MRILLTRHGHVEGIDPPRFRGRADLPLTELGTKQAEGLAYRIAGRWRPTVIYSSPMARCVATGRRIASACDLQNTIHSGLNDLDYGVWQGRTHREVEAEWPAKFNAWHATPHLVRFPDGESLQDLVARTADVLRALLVSHNGVTDVAVLVGHDSVNRALLLQLLDQPLSAYWRLEQSPCALTEIEIVDGRIRVCRVNEAAA